MDTADPAVDFDDAWDPNSETDEPRKPHPGMALSYGIAYLVPSLIWAGTATILAVLVVWTVAFGAESPLGNPLRRRWPKYDNVVSVYTLGWLVSTWSLWDSIGGWAVVPLLVGTLIAIAGAFVLASREPQPAV